MPFTPFHFGIALLLFAVMPFLDPLALFVGSVIPDIEGITAIFIFPYWGLPWHGPLHSFLGVIVLGVITGGMSYLILKHSTLKLKRLGPFRGTEEDVHNFLKLR